MRGAAVRGRGEREEPSKAHEGKYSIPDVGTINFTPPGKIPSMLTSTCPRANIRTGARPVVSSPMKRAIRCE
jgi:hypothetical protein